MKKRLLQSFIFFLVLLFLSQGTSAKKSSTGCSSVPDALFQKNRMIRSNFNQKLSLTFGGPSVLQLRGGGIISSKKKSFKEEAAAKARRDLKSAFAKIFIGSIVASFLMHQVLLLACDLANDFRDNTFVTVVQFLLIGTVVFGSSTYGAIIDNGLSAATKQLLSPNEIPGDADWYSNLKKPSWNPPGWVFPIMWLIISKPTQFVALWKLKEVEGNELALLVYSIHLSLGDAWNKIFFGLQQIKAGVVTISTFWALLVTSAYLFYVMNPTAGLFLVPTCLWVTVASSLNWNIFLNN